MNKSNFKYIYGPVYSWRLGMSLGIDPISTEHKVCNFDCSYCQLGLTKIVSSDRKIFVEVDAIMKEVKALPKDLKIDYYTFSGRGEPTLASNLGEMIDAIKKSKEHKVAVITNAGLISREDVQKDLLKADFVLAKLDASSENELNKINRPSQKESLIEIVEGIKEFKKNFRGKLAIQVMFLTSNQESSAKIAAILKAIHPDEIQLNTPLRPSGEIPLTVEEMEKIKNSFAGLPFKMVYDFEKLEYQPIDDKSTEKRHGNFKIKQKKL